MLIPLPCQYHSELMLLGVPATSASKLSEKIIRFQWRTRSSLQTWVYIVKASPEFHWKMASMPLLDEAMHKSGVKVGVGTPNLCTIQVFQETWENKNDCSLLGIYIYCSHTCCYWLAGRTTCGLYMTPQCLNVLIFTVSVWWRKTLNTRFPYEHIECRPFSIETLEML
jgi:hypothetical protein